MNKELKPKRTAPMPNEYEVLRRMLATPPDPKIAPKKKAKKRTK
jgi:hypothetical protein